MNIYNTTENRTCRRQTFNITVNHERATKNSNVTYNLQMKAV